MSRWDGRRQVVVAGRRQRPMPDVGRSAASRRPDPSDKLSRTTIEHQSMSRFREGMELIALASSVSVARPLTLPRIRSREGTRVPLTRLAGGRAPQSEERWIRSTIGLGLPGGTIQGHANDRVVGDREIRTHGAPEFPNPPAEPTQRRPHGDRRRGYRDPGGSAISSTIGSRRTRRCPSRIRQVRMDDAQCAEMRYPGPGSASSREVHQGAMPTKGRYARLSRAGGSADLSDVCPRHDRIQDPVRVPDSPSVIDSIISVRYRTRLARRSRKEIP